MQMKTIPCIHCGNDVQLPKMSNTLRTWCSKECRIRYKDMKKQLQVEERIERVTHCLECGEMTVPDTKKDRNFCSKSCYQTWLRKDRLSKGICTRCQEPAVEGKTLCEKHNTLNNEKTKQIYREQYIKKDECIPPRKCESCKEMYQPGRKTQRYCTRQCKDDYRNRQRAHAAKANQDAKKEFQRFLAEHGLCRICPPSDPHYAIPGRKACAYHTALARYNRGVQLGQVEDGWKPKKSDYTLVPFDANNPLNEEQLEERMFEPAAGEVGFEEIMSTIREYYSHRVPDAEHWKPVMTPRELHAAGVKLRAQRMLWQGRLPHNILIHSDGAIEVSRSSRKPQHRAEW